MRKAFVLFVVLALAGGAFGLEAGQFGLQAKAAGILPFGDLGNRISFGVGFGGGALLGMAENAAVEMSFAYYMPGNADDLDADSLDYNQKVYELYTGFRFFFATEGTMIPYAGMAVGFSNYKFTNWRVEEGSWGGKIGFNGGGGLMYGFSESAYLDVGARFYYVPSFAENDEGDPSAGTYLGFGAGVTFFLGH